MRPIQPLRIGIYGVGGTGKTRLSKQLSRHTEVIKAIDGSHAIDQVVEGGLATFKGFDDSDKLNYRRLSIEYLQTLFEGESKHLLITGHYSFFKNGSPEVVWTEYDARFYDLIFLLEPTISTLCDQIENDNHRSREANPDLLNQWMTAEREGLTTACTKAGIPLVTLSGDQTGEALEKQIIEKISIHAMSLYARKLSQKYENFVLCDCDGTLNREDAVNSVENTPLNDVAITKIFKQYPGYCFDAFYEVSCFFEAHKQDVDRIVTFGNRNLTANRSTIEKLQALTSKKNTHIVFISSGIPCAWKSAIRDFKEHSLIGGACFFRYGTIVTNEVKEAFAKELFANGKQITAIGNGTNDLGMLMVSHHPIVAFDQQPKQHLLKALKKAGKRVELLKLR